MINGTLVALVKLKDGNLIKVHTDGEDYECTCGSLQPRWFSVWRSDVIGSLNRAITEYAESISEINDIQYL